MTTWKQIKEHEGYYISNTGKVVSDVRFWPPRELKAQKVGKKDNQYLSYHIYGKKRRAHRLVGIAFLPNPNNYPMIDHKNQDKLDNRVENLIWCNRSQNKANTKVYKSNKLGVKGIRKTKAGTYRVRISHNKKTYSLGTHKTLEEAVKVFNKKGKELFGEFFCPSTI